MKEWFAGIWFMVVLPHYRAIVLQCDGMLRFFPGELCSHGRKWENKEHNQNISHGNPFSTSG
jgi:hypothetical protein